jgi:hypothetical protein
MNKKIISMAFLLILAISVLSMASHLISADTTTPVLSVVPTGAPGATTNSTLIPAAAVGSTFTVDIRVDNIGSVTSGINGLSYSLTYDPTVLVISAWHLKQVSFWGTTAAGDLTAIPTNKSGVFTESSIIVPSGAPNEAANTPGVASQITFKVLSSGQSNLNFQPSDVGVAYLTYPDTLGNSHDVVATTINAVYNQLVSPTPTPTPIHTPTPTPTSTPIPTPNPALTTTTTGIIFSPNPANANFSIAFSATVTGSFPSGTITWSTNSTTGSFTPSTEQTSLTAGTSTISYTDSKSGNVTVTANYSGDSNNNPSGKTINVIVYPEDDFNHDGVANFQDIMFFATAYITANSGGEVNASCDLNHDGKLNFTDLELFVAAYTA